MKFAKVHEIYVIAVLLTLASIGIYLMLGKDWTTYLSVAGAAMYAVLQIAICCNEKFAEYYFASLRKQPLFTRRPFVISTNLAFVACQVWLLSVGWTEAFYAGLIIFVASKAHAIRAGIPGSMAFIR